MVAPEVAPGILERAAAGKLRLDIREFMPGDLDGARLVIVATSRRAVNRWIAKLSESRNIPVNVVDDREASRFIVPAIIDRDPVLVAISTGGASPVLARRLRERLEALIPQRIGALAAWLESLRAKLRRKLRGTDARRRFFETIVDGAAARRFIEGDVQGAARIAHQLLTTSAAAPPRRRRGRAGGRRSGRPGTVDAEGAARAAGCGRHSVRPFGVRRGSRSGAARRGANLRGQGSRRRLGCTQEEINALLIELAGQGKRVVRLKGGDPFVFGRGGEELQALAAAQINFSVVPGITAAVGAAAYAGIPLTHRDHAHSVSFVTGHHPGGPEPDWHALGKPGTTAVFYMGLARLEDIAAKLLEHGAAASRPAGIIAQGTTANQRVVTATLGTIRKLSIEANLQSPALLIVGDVVALHSALAWFNAGAAVDLSQTA